MTIDELKLKINKNSRLIGLDLGSKRIGVSISDEKRLIATPLKTINISNQSNFIFELNKIINENRIEGIIVGDPLNMDGTSGKSSIIFFNSIASFSKILDWSFNC